MGDISKGVANTLNHQNIYKKYKIKNLGFFTAVKLAMTIEFALIKSYCRIIYSIYHTVQML
jgi:hypothetical protein